MDSTFIIAVRAVVHRLPVDAQENEKWRTVGESPLEVILLHSKIYDGYRLLGRIPETQQVPLFVPLSPTTIYIRCYDDYHQFLFNGFYYGLVFSSRAVADNFGKAVYTCLELLNPPSLKMIDQGSVMFTNMRVHSGTIPASLGGHSATLVGKAIFIFGGFPYQQIASNSMYCFDPVGLTFTPISSESIPTSQGGLVKNTNSRSKPPSARYGHSCVLIRSRTLLIFGGYDGENFHNDIHLFDTATKMWTRPKVFGEPPSPRYKHTATIVGKLMFVFGGFGGGGLSVESGLNPALFVLDTEKWHWSKVGATGISPSARQGHSCVYHNRTHSLILYAGQEEEDNFLNDLYALNIEDKAWTRLPNRGQTPYARTEHASCILDDSLFVTYGGCGQNKEFFGDIQVYDLDHECWLDPPTIEGCNPPKRAMHSATMFGGDIFIFGGYDNSKGSIRLVYNDFYMVSTSIGSKGSLASDIKMALTDMLYCDASFVCRDAHRLGCHRAFLIARGLTLPLDGNDFYMEHISHEIVQRWLFYVYTDVVEFQEEDMDDLKEISEKFGTMELMHILERNQSPCRKLPTALKKLCDAVIGLKDNMATDSQPEFEKKEREIVDCSDVTLVVEQHSFFCHRFILSARCAYFRTMFESGFRERNQNTVRLVNVTCATMETVLRYIYTGDFATQPESDPVEILATAEMYGLDRLKKSCESLLSSALETENACYLLSIADQYSAPHLKESSMKFVIHHIEEQSVRKSLSTLSHEIVAEVQSRYVAIHPTNVLDITKPLSIQSESSEILTTKPTTISRPQPAQASTKQTATGISRPQSAQASTKQTTNSTPRPQSAQVSTKQTTNSTPRTQSAQDSTKPTTAISSRPQSAQVSTKPTSTFSRPQSAQASTKPTKPTTNSTPRTQSAQASTTTAISSRPQSAQASTKPTKPTTTPRTQSAQASTKPTTSTFSRPQSAQASTKPTKPTTNSTPRTQSAEASTKLTTTISSRPQSAQASTKATGPISTKPTRAISSRPQQTQASTRLATKSTITRPSSPPK